MQAGMARHFALVSALIEAGRLQQGIADWDFRQAGMDRRTPHNEALGAFVRTLAASTFLSWRSLGAEMGSLPALPDAAGLPRQVELKVPEGFAFYSLYPEAVAEAALRLKLEAPPRVIGIRSIGTSLAAVAAAALDAPAAVTVRPFGDPFDRRIAVDTALEQDLLKTPAHYIVVDEGPGLSGSSFGAVADWLESRNVPSDRIAVLPSHGGSPGPETPARHRERWPRLQRIASDFGRELPALIGRWAEDLLGPLEAEPVDLSGGEWRRLRFGKADAWPAVNPAWERRKFQLRAHGRDWIAKFVGLGPEGDRKLAIARKLSVHGLVPEPVGLVHGFLIEAWHGEAKPLEAGEQPLESIALYFGRRARSLDPPRAGATLAQLLTMAKRNAGLALGSWAEERLDLWSPRLESLQARVVPMCTDGRLDRHEWIRHPGGHLLKTDALDHHCGHDLIGCQDLAWDVAGASVEFALDQRQARWLAAAAGQRAGRLIDPELLRFTMLAYLAFRLGHASLSVRMSPTADSDRWRKRADGYARQRERRLSGGEPDATRDISAIGRQPERTGAGTIPTHSG